MDEYSEMESLLTQEDKLYINKQVKEPMDEETKNWTSLDLYYKGFHIKKSWGENISRVTLMSEIDALIQAGFKPSWNEDTNKSIPQAAVVAPKPVTEAPGGLTAKCKDCGADMVYKSGFKNDKKWEGLFCPNAVKEDKTKHKPAWL